MGNALALSHEPGHRHPSQENIMETNPGTQGGARIIGKPSKHLFEHEGPGPRIMAADTLENERVCNAEGEHLGNVDHIMLDVPSGRIAYAVLSFGGFLGMGDK